MDVDFEGTRVPQVVTNGRFCLAGPPQYAGCHIENGIHASHAFRKKDIDNNNSKCHEGAFGAALQRPFALSVSSSKSHRQVSPSHRSRDGRASILHMFYDPYKATRPRPAP